MSSIGNDAIVDFEDKNRETLIEKFIEKPNIRDLWEDFIYNEYMAFLNYEPDDMDDDT